MTYQLPKLPYEQNALEPHISSNLMSFHYGKHHQGYVNKFNELVQGTPLADQPLEKIIKDTFNKSDQKAVFNNSAQIFNHTFFWNSMKPHGGGAPKGKLAEKINQTWGNFDTFRKEFSTKATTLFGSGWVWLSLNGDKLEIVQTKDAETPLATGQKPILTLDVWEHAYYLDYQNRRPDFIETFLSKLVNWDFAEKNFG